MESTTVNTHKMLALSVLEVCYTVILYNSKCKAIYMGSCTDMCIIISTVKWEIFKGIDFAESSSQFNYMYISIHAVTLSNGKI